MHTLTHTATGRRRVLLHNDNYNRREYVVRVLLKVVEGFTVDEAVNCMQVWCAVADAALVRTHGRAGRRWLRRGGCALQAAGWQWRRVLRAAPAWHDFARVLNRPAHAPTPAPLAPGPASQEAHINGLALVTMCAQETAERYVESLRMNGLISTLEPAGPGGN